MIREIVTAILVWCLRRVNPDFDKRVTEYENAKRGVEAKEKTDDAAIAAGQQQISDDAATIEDAHKLQQQTEHDADEIARQRKTLRDQAAADAPARPADDDLLTGPLPGA
jgi:hypothetical protein